MKRLAVLLVPFSLVSLVEACPEPGHVVQDTPGSPAEFIVLLVIGFFVAFIAAGTLVCFFRSWCAEWRYWHPDVQSADTDRKYHPIKVGVWLPTIAGFIISSCTYHLVLNPIARSKHNCHLDFTGNIGGFAGFFIVPILVCCVFRFRPKKFDQASYDAAQAAFDQECADVAAQLEQYEKIDVTIQPSGMQVSLSKSYHISHILAHLPYENTTSAATASLSFGGTPLGGQSDSRSLRELDSSIETGAVLHLLGASLDASKTHFTVPLPKGKLSPPDRQNYVTYIQERAELRCRHVYSRHSYEVEMSKCNCNPNMPWDREDYTEHLRQKLQSTVDRAPATEAANEPAPPTLVELGCGLPPPGAPPPGTVTVA